MNAKARFIKKYMNMPNIGNTIINDKTLNNLEEKKEKALNLIKQDIGLIEFKGATDAYWKDLEIANEKVMVLSIPDGTFIRSAINLKQELSSNDVNGNFLILDGLAYKSNTTSESIVYMKV